jgi:hypothetical protein
VDRIDKPILLLVAGDDVATPSGRARILAFTAK